MLKRFFFLFFIFWFNSSFCQNNDTAGNKATAIARQIQSVRIFEGKAKIQFDATTKLLDAIINSTNSLYSVIKKENYRNKITSLNNPTTSDMGFNLQLEIQNALKPMLAKARNTNTSKFSAVVNTILNSPIKSPLNKAISGPSTIFSSLISLVSNLTVGEKRIDQQDLDKFITEINRYFVQYEKLNIANRGFDQSIEKFTIKINDLYFDIREYILDLLTILDKNTSRMQLKPKTLEELLLTYFDNDVFESAFLTDSMKIIYPGDGIKTAKEIVNTIQKLFNEYQKMYFENYTQIRLIMVESKELGKNINVKQLNISINELQELYKDSKEADILNLRLSTLSERLKFLVSTEQVK